MLNRVDRSLFSSFRKLDFADKQVDAHLKLGSIPLGAGSPDLAPPVDIEGRARRLPIDIGAYAY